ncbi:MAG: MFS transporter [Actinomycetota bacterium]|nr:MFS transporter [Actinomycetota bacterium]
MQAPVDVDAVQRHTVRTLVVSQALGGIGLSSGIAVSALVARDVSGSETLAGLAQTGQVLGAAVIAAVLAAYMSRHGRRPGLALGYLLGALGALLCIVAAVLSTFPLLLVGCVLLGATTAANQQSRYAATDLAHPARRGRDLSTVVWATTIGSVLGPNLTGPGAVVAGWMHAPAKAGPYVFTAVALVLTATFVLVRLRPDPLLTARSVVAPADGPEGRVVDAPSAADRDASRRTDSAWEVLRNVPRVRAAAVGMALTHAVMVSVMVMTPIHMDHGHASLEVIGLVISMHVLGMYALSPLVGRAVDRVGSPPVLGAGAVVLLVALALAGGSAPGGSVTLAIGLFLLGLGWSLGTVASSTLLTASTPAAQRPQVQGLADMLTGFTAAAGGAVAGVVVGTLGYGWLNAGAAVVALGALATSVVAARHTRERATTAS